MDCTFGTNGFHWQADIEKLRHAAHALSAYLLNFNMTLPEKCLNTEFFSVPNAGKYGPEQTLYLDIFHVV